ncbi:hypothetical protein BDV38DRAFT_284380 [Aspergillus pseudotamarii]|uniref:Polyketide synthase n=1 Tax=Aspergillus pseudotamarii TaxID=132259 RepID=A0A5N6SMJ8_ASPPS|nr:uncharacterized protein BDV38DRAFT_284380 [Aspergillus pseudotamarii]KAE8135902.1 hypothetical protein BDV38DRAFT_284380 [Aspergillus pseudotamarii]
MSPHSTNGCSSPSPNRGSKTKAVNGVLDMPNEDITPVNGKQQSHPVPIAICGMGMRLPGGINDASKLYDFLRTKKDARQPIPKGRFDNDGFYDPHRRPCSLPIDHGYWLDEEDLARFDPSLFSMSLAEVEKLDPQQRVLLEVVRETFENAGETGWRGKNIGCYVGSFGEEWNNIHAKDSHNRGFLSITGYMDLTQANRISMTVRVGCSGAGLGLHLACQAIQLAECSSAIVAGSSVILSPETTILMAEGGALSPDASSKTFDASANGYARADGVNCLYIKRLDEALRDGNPIRAIIRSTCTNSDGKSQALTVPNIDSHEALIRSAYQSLGDPSQTAMVECHGTGTSVGDAIEANAVARVFGDHGVYLGAVKPNLGHSEGASAITSIMKAVIQLENRVILPNIKFEKPNPKIPWVKARLRVPTEPMPWPQDRLERISVNSFGIGGTNVHVVLDSAASYGLSRAQSQLEPDVAKVHPTLLFLSAGHEKSLRQMQDNFLSYAHEHVDQLDDLAYTLAYRRESLPVRGFCVTDGTDNCVVSAPFKAPSPRRTVFCFTGQGSQWPRMGYDLMMRYPEFMQDIHDMDKILHRLDKPPTWTLEAELQKPKETSLINQAEYSQPACTAIQIALVNLLKRWGIVPAAVFGHSSGEIAAAYAAGTISMEEAIIVAYYRGYVSHLQKRPGGMAAVGLGRAEISPWLVPGVIIACENSGSSVTISGDSEPLKAVLHQIHVDRPDVFQRILKIEKAYHSDHMKEVGNLYHDLIAHHLHSREPLIPFFSTVTDTVQQKASQFGARYWQHNLESPVLFYQACKRILQREELHDCIHLEIGPHSALAGPLRQIFAEQNASNPYLSVLKRDGDGRTSFLSCLGELHCRGVSITYPTCSFPYKSLCDLPSYPWHRETAYSDETRVMKNARFRKFPPHDLLGIRTIENSDVEPVWRGMLRLSDVPWLRDHCVGNDIIFPAAGYIAMAGEAIRQLTGLDDFTVRDLSIKTGMILEPNQPTEIITSLRPHRLTDSLDSKYYEFTIQTYNVSTWTKHCSGLVTAGCASQYSGRKVSSFPRAVDQKRWYNAMASAGLRYGPRFTGLDNISAAVNESASFSVASDTRDSTESPYALHPTTIDLILQSCIVALFRGQPRLLRKPLLPTFIDEVYVRGGTTGEPIQINSWGSMGKTCAGGKAHSYAITAEGEPAFSLKGLQFSALDNEAEAESKPLETAHLVWKPHLDFFDCNALISPTNDSELRSANSLNERLFLLCILDAAESIRDAAVVHDHLNSYHTWLYRQLDRVKEPGYPLVPDAQTLVSLPPDQRKAEIQSILKQDTCGSMDATRKAIFRCYEHLPSLLEGRTDPLELMQRDGLLGAYYDCLQDRHEYKTFLQLLGHLRPQMRILEVGAGTGGLTANILACLGSEMGQHLYQEYTYTDVSPGFLVNAKERFKDHPSITYDILDISQDPKEQGFQEGYYDLIIASNVFHATPSLHETLTHAKILLKPGGRLLLQELCNTSKWTNFVFGLFPGWWLGGADGRADEPFIQPEEWDRRLRDAGFEGVQAVGLDAERPYQLNSMIVAQTSDHVSVPPTKVSLLSMDQVHPAAMEVEKHLLAEGYEVDHVLYGQELSQEQDIISFVDLDCPFFDNIPGDRLDSFLRTMENHSLSNIIWLTRPAQIQPKNPRFAQVLGMARTLRSELGLSLTTIEMEDFGPGSVQAIFGVLRAVQRHAMDESASDFDPDYEYAWSNGALQVSRMHWFSLPQALTDDMKDESTTSLNIGQPGLLHTLRWVAEPLEQLPSDEVQVNVQSVGMNFRDLMCAMGVVDDRDGNGNPLGIDSAGLVTSVGEEVTDLEVGDRVLLISPSRGALKTKLQVSRQLCVKIPNNLSFEDSCTMPTVYLTVLRALHDKANLQRGQTVLIHSAAGGVGIAALYYAKSIGAQIYATVSTEEKITFLVETIGIPRQNIFYSRDSTFVEDIMKSTSGRGVDVVLNSLSGDLLHASWKCVAQGGCMVEIGKRDLLGRGKLALDPFLDNRTFFGVDVATLPTMDIDSVQRLLDMTMRLYEKGAILPIHPITIFPADRVEDAFRYLQKGQHMGKVVVNFSQALDLPRAPTVPDLSLRPDKAYLLVGGMGGIGGSIARWMTSNGARHIVFLSRSAGKKEEDKALMHELTEMGCNVLAVAGDVCDISVVRNAVSAAPAPIAGVFQLAMVLADTGVLLMDIEKWNAAVRPKVQGTWNLHEALPSDLGFFVMASSLSGICGYWGQSNYAAANAFLDAFAQYRRSRGLAATAIDLGAVDEVGFVSRNLEVRENVQRMLNTLISEQSLLDCVQLAISRSNPSTKLTMDGYYNPGQLVHGLMSIASTEGQSIWKRDPRLALSYNLETGQPSAGSGRGTGDEVLKGFLMAVQDSPAKLNESSSVSILAREISRQVSVFLMRSGDEDVDLALSLPSFGVDSLVSIEIRNWWKQTLGVDISVLQLMSGASFADLGKKAIDQLKERYLGK